MEFMLIMITERDAPGDPSVFPEMGKFAGELASQGKMRGGAPLRPSQEAVRVRVRDGAPSVTDGPFSETKEVVGGVYLISAEMMFRTGSQLVFHMQLARQRDAAPITRDYVTDTQRRYKEIEG